jgi:hypothetical protein
VARPISQAESVGNPLIVEHVTTTDLLDGQVCPPYYDGAVWCVVHRSGGRALWRRLFLKTKQIRPRVFRSLEEWRRDPWV